MVDLEPYPEAKAVLEESAEVRYLPPDHGVLVDAIADYDAYFGHIHVRVDRPVIEGGTRLKAIATPTTGTDHIDLDAAREQGIEVVCIKTEHDLLDTFTATAELAWGLLIACVREIPAAHRQASAGHWDRDLFTGRQLSGKTLGILGYGRLGKMVAEYGKAFRMRVLACDVKDFSAPGVARVSFDTLMRESDVISLHLHLTPETTGIISREAFGTMRRGVVIINTSRGALIGEGAFLEALESGKVSAAGLDMIHGEWNEHIEEHPLVGYAATHRNLVITPHIGGSTYETNRDARLFTARKLMRYLMSPHRK
jgi:D-3-phosphoglycerate dehydrogenase